MTNADRIRAAAVGRMPREPYLIGAWIGRDDDAWGAIAASLDGMDQWWDRSVPIEVRRMFLLFVAEANA